MMRWDWLVCSLSSRGPLWSMDFCQRAHHRNSHMCREGLWFFQKCSEEGSYLSPSMSYLANLVSQITNSFSYLPLLGNKTLINMSHSYLFTIFGSLKTSHNHALKNMKLRPSEDQFFSYIRNLFLDLRVVCMVGGGRWGGKGCILYNL